jgi:hypothetical protein
MRGKEGVNVGVGVGGGGGGVEEGVGVVDAGVPVTRREGMEGVKELAGKMLRFARLHGYD